MPLHVFAVHGAVLLQPFLHERAVRVVVIDPPLVARVVGRVDVDALDATRIPRQQGFQGVKVVPVNDEVAIADFGSVVGSGRGTLMAILMQYITGGGANDFSASGTSGR